MSTKDSLSSYNSSSRSASSLVVFLNLDSRIVYMFFSLSTFFVCPSPMSSSSYMRFFRWPFLSSSVAFYFYISSSRRLTYRTSFLITVNSDLNTVLLAMRLSTLTYNLFLSAVIRSKSCFLYRFMAMA